MSDPSFYPPENYYRVSIKALVFDRQRRVLVFKDEEGTWAMPGGGLDHAETYEECVRREMAEEAGVQVTTVGPELFSYRCSALNNRPKIAIATQVTLASQNFIRSDELSEARYVTKEEFLKLPFEEGEAPIQHQVDKIWPPVEKNTVRS